MIYLYFIGTQNTVKQKTPSLAVFATFKTKREELTGEAIRQRSIIAALASQSNPVERTRTAISKRLATERGGKMWKNIYSGIFRDLDEVLIPLDLAVEEGRLPLKRGPKALQEQGNPYYQLTARGLVVALSLKEVVGKKKILKTLVKGGQLDEQMAGLAGAAPDFFFLLIEKYVKAYCEGGVEDLIPLNFKTIKSGADGSLKILREFLDGFLKGTEKEKETMTRVLRLVS